MPSICILGGSKNGFNVHVLNEIRKRGEMHPHKQGANDTRDLNILSVAPTTTAQI